jgi:2-C-methyl-D-erythritol 4-phosphate cytidylyltransferase
MQADRNKVYLSIRDQPILAYSLETVARAPGVAEVVVVARPEDEAEVAPLVTGILGRDRVRLVHGGPTRHASEHNGIEALRPQIEAGEIDVVAVHDGARPFASPALFDRVLSVAATVGGAIPGTPVEEALYALDQQTYVDASEYVWAQTPQAFAATPLLDAHAAAHDQGFEGLDTAQVVETYGGQAIEVVAGESTNIKITFNTDLEVAEGIADNWHAGPEPGADRGPSLDH